MDFNLSPEHLLIRKMMAEFTENEVKPIAAETDAKTLYPRENIEKLFDLGVMGMCIPKEYGGQGADPLASAICIEELSKQCASTGDIVATHNGLCCGPIINFGTEEQKKKYLPEQPFLRSVTAPVIHLKCFISIRFRCAQNHLPSESVSNTHKH